MVEFDALAPNLAVTSEDAVVRPGQSGVPVVVVLSNPTSQQVESAIVRLLFMDGVRNRGADFAVRQGTPFAGRLEPNETVELHFEVDVGVNARAVQPVSVFGRLDYQVSGRDHVATAAPVTWVFEPVNPELVVTTAADQDDPGDGGPELSLREALRIAHERIGIDRIRFDPVVFPEPAGATIVLSASLPELPALRGDQAPVLISATPGTVALRPEAALGEAHRFGLRIVGPAAVAGLRFEQFSMFAPARPVGGECPVEGALGGAILVEGGEQVVLRDNAFSDVGLGARDCHQGLVRLAGGAGHELSGNDFQEIAAAAASLWVPDVTLRSNRIAGGAGDGVVFARPAGAYEVSGNLLVDLQGSGLSFAAGAASARLVHNTFVRCAAAALRSAGGLGLTLRNGVYYANRPAALAVEPAATPVDAAHEAFYQNEYCLGCLPGAAHQSTAVQAPLGLVDATGTTWEQLAPGWGSPLVDTGLDVSDRNGGLPGRWFGRGPDRGAVELQR